MLERLEEMRDEARILFGSFEPRLYSGEEAIRLVEVNSELERIFAAGKLKAAIRVEETRAHEEDGHTGAASWLAEITGEPVGAALGGLETMRSASKHPLVEVALSNGEISVAQAKQIASASEASPETAASLLDAAVDMSFDQLKKRCDDVRFSSRSNAEEIDRHERIRRSRSLRTWVDHQGAGHLQAKMTSDALAVLRGSLGQFERQVLKENPDRDEPRAAYQADALIAMAEAALNGPASTGTPEAAGTDTAGPDTAGSDKSDATDTHHTKKRRRTAAQVILRIRVDLEALKRGYTIAGETCSIPGIGPVPVEVARSVLGEALLELVITDGTDVSTVVTDSRTIRRALRVALEERDPTCCVPGCDTADPLEVDHYVTDFVAGGTTEAANLARLCSYHHYVKTHKGWRLEGGPGHWRFVCPDDGTRDTERRDALF
jgi:hypothetical protein